MSVSGSELQLAQRAEGETMNDRDRVAVEEQIRAALRLASTPEQARQDICERLPLAQVRSLQVEMGETRRSARILAQAVGYGTVQTIVSVPAHEFKRN